MIGESFAIIAVIGVMLLMLMRSEKRELALMALPFLLVPLFYIAGSLVSALSSLEASVLYPGMVVAGGIVGFGGCAALAYFIKHRAVKMMYLGLAAIFQFAIACAYMINL